MSALNAAMACADAATARLDAFMKGAKGAGKKGSGKTGADSSKPSQLCPICSKGYHWKADCWQNAAKGGGKGDKGDKGGKAVDHRGKRMGLNTSNAARRVTLKRIVKAGWYMRLLGTLEQTMRSFTESFSRHWTGVRLVIL